MAEPNLVRETTWGGGRRLRLKVIIIEMQRLGRAYVPEFVSNPHGWRR
jgi:hypothetical protein